MEQLAAAQQEEVRRATETDCGSSDGNDVTVCGRRPRALGSRDYRVPHVPEPGARTRLIAGEPPGGMAAMGAGGCLRLCHQPVTIDLIGGDRSAVNTIRRGIDRLLHGE